MPISAPLRLLAAAALIVPIASACAPNEPVATQPGTTPSVWTGSPPPSAPARRRRRRGTSAADRRDADRRPEDGRRHLGRHRRVRVLRRLRHGHREDHRAGPADARLPRHAHPLGGQVRAELGRPDRRRARRLQLRGWALPGRRPHRASGQRRPVVAAGARRRFGDVGDHHRRLHRGGSARPAPRRRSSSTRRPTTSPTSRRSATSRSTARPAPTRRRWPPATPASGWRAVSFPPE